MKRNIRLKIAYDGTDFCGWQIQNNHRTVQGDIESALKKIEGKIVRLTGSGRTDSGVHANGQVANFFTESNVPAAKFVPAINSLLKNDVCVVESIEMPENFHARFNAKKRIYYYYLKAGRKIDPFCNRFCWNIWQQPDIKRLNTLASPLVGVHDFTAFTAAGDQSSSRVREIFSACFFIQGEFIVFKISGNAFLWKMVRSITGTIVELESKGASAGDIKYILDKKNRENVGSTAPARGLFLERVVYE